MTNNTLVVCGMAVLPDRFDFANLALASLAPQVDRLFVTINDTDATGHGPKRVAHPFSSEVIWSVADNSRGDAEKFWGLDVMREEGITDFYFFSCDDDLIYPDKYVTDMVRYIERFKREAIVSLHGSLIPRPALPINSFYGERSGIGCLQPWGSFVKVDFPGTGVMAYHSSTIDLCADDFPYPNMADIHVGIKALREGVPVMTCPHFGEGDYLKYNRALPTRDTIWGRHHRDDSIQTRLINEALCSDQE